MENRCLSSLPYIARPIRYLGLAEPNGYRLKQYAILYGGGPFREADFATRACGLPSKSLPTPGGDRRCDPGSASPSPTRATARTTRSSRWWDNENELPLAGFRPPADRRRDWRPARGGESVCVWDLEVIWFERQAYVRDGAGRRERRGLSTNDESVNRDAEALRSERET